MPKSTLLYRRRTQDVQHFKIRDRDEAVVDAVYRYRMLERRQVEQLFFAPPDGRATNTNRTRERLRFLTREKYLARISRPVHEFMPHPGPVYRLAGRGAALLAERTGLSVRDFQYWGIGDDQDRHATSVSHLFLAHGIALADVRIALERSARLHSYVIEVWQDEVDLRRAKEWDTVFIDRVSGKKEPIKITPDGYVVLQTPRGRGHFFIEMDRSTESIKTAWQRKILGYKAYALGGRFQQRYGVTQSNAAFRVLTVTLSALRAEYLKAAAERYGSPEASSRFLFAPLEALMTRDPLNDPIWLRAGATGQHTVL